MPSYRRYGKLTNVLLPGEFEKGLSAGKFVKVPDHKGLCVFLYYSGCRISEALNMKRQDFRVASGVLYADIKRLKHSKQTDPIELLLSSPFIEFLESTVYQVKKKERRVWPYCRKTGYNIVNRAFDYPHHFRLSRITQLFLKGYTIPEVQSFTGLTVGALEHYIAKVDIKRIREDLE